MQELTNPKQLPCAHLIKSVIDRSSPTVRGYGEMKRVRIVFTNGHDLSIVRGDGSYGHCDGLFEIMPSNPEFLDNFTDGDDRVEGWLTVERVNYYINKIANL
jgi:hypothetical protein